MIRIAMNPPDDEPLLDVFDLIEGANLKISIFSELKGGKKQRNYSRSKWLERGPLADEEKLEKIYDELNSDPKWSLKQYLADDKFKTFEQLKARLDYVLGYDSETGTRIEVNSVGSGRPRTSSTTDSESKTETVSKASTNDSKSKPSSFFQKLVDEDDDDEIPF